MNNEKLFHQIKDLIQVELDNCDPSTTPGICAAQSTEEGKKALEEKLIRYCAKGYSVQEAIAQVEREISYLEGVD